MSIEIVIRDGGQDFTYEVSKETADAIETICEADNAGFERDQERRKETLIMKLEGMKLVSTKAIVALAHHERCFNDGIEESIKAIKGGK